jgi:drug/metabolite transporter (DMT)-like permease
MATAYKAPLGASLVVLSSFFYASYGIWTTLMGNYFNGFTASVFRSAFVVLLLSLVVMYAKSWEKVQWKRDWLYLLGLVVTATLTWGPLYYGILHAGIGLSIAVNYGAILIGMFLFGWLLIREKFTKDKFLSCALGLAGLALVFVHPTSGVTILALAAAALSGLASAANMVITKKISYAATQSTILTWSAAFLANLGAVLIFNIDWPELALHIEWLYLLLFAIASVAASWSFVRGSKLIDAGSAGVLGLLEIVFGLVYGVLLFNEQLNLVILLGVVLIMAAAAIPYIKDYDRTRGKLT